MKTAIIYYSMCGNTAYTAEQISKVLDKEVDIIEIMPIKKYPDKGFKKYFWGGKSAVMAEKPKLESYSFKADEYDEIIIGFPVWASRPAPPICTFAQDNKTSLQSKRISAYACQSGAGAEKALKNLKDLIGISEYNAVMVLNDPKDKPNSANDKIIKDFCSKL